MITKEQNKSIVVAFGVGDILISEVIVTGNHDKLVYCGLGLEQIEEGEIGRGAKAGLKKYRGVRISQPVRLIFSDPKSVDVFIKSLNEIKKRMNQVGSIPYINMSGGMEVMAKVMDFAYRKKPEEEVQQVKLLCTVKGDSFVSGINLAKLSEDEESQVMKIQEEYEASLKPFMKAFRRYNNDKVVKEEVEAEDAFK